MPRGILLCFLSGLIRSRPSLLLVGGCRRVLPRGILLCNRLGFESPAGSFRNGRLACRPAVGLPLRVSRRIGLGRFAGNQGEIEGMPGMVLGQKTLDETVDVS